MALEGRTGSASVKRRRTGSARRGTGEVVERGGGFGTALEGRQRTGPRPGRHTSRPCCPQGVPEQSINTGGDTGRPSGAPAGQRGSRAPAGQRGSGAHCGLVVRRLGLRESTQLNLSIRRQAFVPHPPKPADSHRGRDRDRDRGLRLAGIMVSISTWNISEFPLQRQ